MGLFNEKFVGNEFSRSPAGVKRRDALNKTMAHPDRYPNAVVDFLNPTGC